MQFGTLKDFKGNSIPLNTAIDLDTLFYTPSEVTKIETIEFKLLYENTVQIEYNVVSIIICNSDCISCDINDFSQAITSKICYSLCY